MVEGGQPLSTSIHFVTNLRRTQCLLSSARLFIRICCFLRSWIKRIQKPTSIVRLRASVTQVVAIKNKSIRCKMSTQVLTAWHYARCETRSYTQTCMYTVIAVARQRSMMCTSLLVSSAANGFDAAANLLGHVLLHWWGPLHFLPQTAHRIQLKSERLLEGRSGDAATD